MARKPRTMFAGAIYHVTSRGNERRETFRDDMDRKRFLERLADSAISHQVRVLMYCLMPNHIHLLVETPLGNLDRFMGSLLTGYTVYFNLRHDRSGHLLQGRYAAQVVEGNEYLLKLSRYVHLNPVHVENIRNQPLDERRRYLRAYRWSSYPEYAAIRPPCGWLSTGSVLSMTNKSDPVEKALAYVRFVEEGLAEADDEFLQLMKQRRVAIGSDAFVEGVMDQMVQKAKNDLRREDVSFRQIRKWKPPEEVEAVVRRVVGERDWADFAALKKGRLLRGFAAWALQQHAGLTQRDIAARMGLGTGSAVSHMIRSTMGLPAMVAWRREFDRQIGVSP
jgi:putative transposase